MTGPEHWSEAELLLGESSCEYGCPHSGCPHEMRLIARAQVHATLAFAEAYVAGAAMRPEDRDEWDRATGRLEPGGSDPDRPETWSFGEPPETTGWHDVPDPKESQP